MMKFEYDFFLLHAAPYLADERRVAMKKWLDELGEQGWEVVHLGPMKESEAGVVAWAKRRIVEVPQLTAAYWKCDACGSRGSGFRDICPYCNSGMIRQGVAT